MSFLKKEVNLSLVWWFLLVILTLRRSKWEDHFGLKPAWQHSKFQLSLGYRMGPYQEKQGVNMIWKLDNINVIIF